ncbi:primosomal protein N' [Haloferula helveola]
MLVIPKDFGRDSLEGEVTVQTFTPHIPSIQFARHHDFDGFAEQELEMRRQFHFPPFTRCAVLTSRSTHEHRAEYTLETLHCCRKEAQPPRLRVQVASPKSFSGNPSDDEAKTVKAPFCPPLPTRQ